MNRPWIRGDSWAKHGAFHGAIHWAIVNSVFRGLFLQLHRTLIEKSKNKGLKQFQRKDLNL